MDGSNPMMPDRLDQDLADALRIQPSGEFRAQIRARVGAEAMKPAWHAPVRVAVAGFACLVAFGAIWTLTTWSLPTAEVPGPARRTAVAQLPHGPTASRPPAPRADLAGLARPALRDEESQERASAGAPVLQEAIVPVVNDPEVLLSDSERNGVRLLFESIAAGRLELPEDMLQDLSLPIVEARTGFPDLDSPWIDSSEGDVQ